MNKQKARVQEARRDQMNKLTSSIQRKILHILDRRSSTQRHAIHDPLRLGWNPRYCVRMRHFVHKSRELIPHHSIIVVLRENIPSHDWTVNTFRFLI